MNVRAVRLATSQVILPKCGFGVFFLLNTEQSSQRCFLRTCLRGYVQADLCLPCLHSKLPGSHPEPILEATYTHWRRVVPRLTALPLGRAWKSAGVLHKAFGLEMFCIQPACSIQETYGGKSLENTLFFLFAVYIYISPILQRNHMISAISIELTNLELLVNFSLWERETLPLCQENGLQTHQNPFAYCILGITLKLFSQGQEKKYPAAFPGKKLIAF